MEVISYSAPVISGPLNKSSEILFTEIRQVPDTLVTVARATDPRVQLEKISILEQNPPLDNENRQVPRLENFILNFSPITTAFLTEFSKIINNFQLSCHQFIKLNKFL